jgi:hypothetical protein
LLAGHHVLAGTVEVNWKKLLVQSPFEIRSLERSFFDFAQGKLT